MLFSPPPEGSIAMVSLCMRLAWPLRRVMAQKARPNARRVVVLVEDEPMIRVTAAEALADAGFDVVEARHAGEAIAALQSRANDVHALFTDVQMPGGINGVDLARKTRKCWPWIAILVTSGAADPHATALPEGSRFLRKPYRFGHLVDHLREMVYDHPAAL
jgi:two-component system, response regulator PdtaR